MENNKANLNITAVIENNSISYAKSVFSLLQEGTTFCAIQYDGDYRSNVVSPIAIIETNSDSGWFSPPRLELESTEKACITFSSGTEGEPKGIVLTYENLNDVVNRLVEVMEMTGEIKEYIGVPIYHSFGFGRLRAIGDVDGECYIPPNGFNPIELVNLIKNEGVNAISMVPSLFRILYQSGLVSREIGKKIRWIELGSQHLSSSEKKQLIKLFPNAKIVQHYGLTEASRTTFLRLDKANETELSSVGTVTNDIEIDTTPEGLIKVKGPHAAGFVFKNGKLIELLDDGWLTTSDLGEIRRGLLFYKGRADDVVNLAGVKFSPENLEARLKDKLTNVNDFAIVRVKDELRGESIGLVLTYDSDSQYLIDCMKIELADMDVRGISDIPTLVQDEIPKTSTGKVKRRELSELFNISNRETMGPIPKQQNDNKRDNTQSIIAVFQSVFPNKEIKSDDTFNKLGGDSLNYIQMTVAIEKQIGTLPEDWENTPIKKLVTENKAKDLKLDIEPVVWLRAMAILAIVSNAAAIFGEFRVYGGAFLLFTLAGYSFARFQLKQLQSGSGPWIILSTLPKLLVVVLGIIVFEQIRLGDYEVAQFLFIGNLISPEIGGYWFINVWVQIYIALFLLFSIFQLDQLTKLKPKLSSYLMLTASVLIAFLVPYIWNTDYLYDRVPHIVFWMFILGWFLYVNQDTKWLNSLLVICLFLLFEIKSATMWVCVGALVIIWAPVIRINRSIVTTISMISAASLYMYITKDYSISLTVKLMQIDYIPIAGFMMSIIVGIAVMYIVDYGWRIVTKIIKTNS